MNKKKIFSIFLTSSLIVGTPLQALAVGIKPSTSTPTELSVTSINTDEAYTDTENMQLSKEAAQKKSKEILEKYFQININDKDFKCNSDLSSYKNNIKTYNIWNIYWYSDSYNSRTVINMTLNADTGDLIAMYNGEYDKTSNSSIPNLSIEEGKKISDTFIKNINPEEYKLCELSKDKWFSNRGNSTDYSFTYVRNLYGAKYYDNYISVTVNGITGKVVSYVFNWDKDIKVPPMPKINLSKISENKFKEEMNLTLKYKLFNNKYEFENKENSKNIKLVYEPSFEKGYLIDATTGEFIKNSYENTYHIEHANLSDKEKNNFYSKYKKLENYKKPLEKADASKLLENKIQQLYGKDYKIKDLNYRENDISYKSNEDKTWTAYFSKELNSKENGQNTEKEATKEGYIRINALTGEIISTNLYSYFDYNEKFTPKFTWKEGYHKALDLIGEYYPSRVKNIELQLTHKTISYKINEEREPERFYSYYFTRKVNGILYENDYISIHFNTKTGELSSMDCSWDDSLVFQNPSKILSASKSKDSYSSKYKPELRFIWQNTSKDPKKSKMELKLVYALDNNNIYIDAFTNKMLNNYDGEEIKFDISEFLNEIKGSPAEKEIKILAYKGLIDTKDFKLKKEIRNMDLIKTLVDALGYTPYIVNENSKMKMESASDSVKDESTSTLTKEDYIKMASYYGFIEGDIKNFDIDKKVSREEMCKTLIRFLNYDTIANCKDIFVIEAQDSKEVSKDAFGYVALAKGLNIIELKENKIEPKSIVTMEDLALSLFRALQNKEKSYNVYPIYK